MAEKKMIIDGVSCPFTTERNVLEVARNNGIDIPSLCYCENLSIYGGCRLCLVENDRGKMDAACSMQPRDGMVVNTHTKQVLDSRRTTLQLLMSSHRADCLTCDQSGRCKLQEYARRYHVDAHRFEPNTYCTEPMDLSSPSIVRDPSKCILCGLCVRTCAEIQNIGAVDFSGRGKKAHISADFGKTLMDTDCVGCGQCASVCPTGASPCFMTDGGFPTAACISVNDEIIHGIPGDRVLHEGDIVSVDVGARYRGFNGDCAGTFPCGKCSDEALRLIRITRQSFFEGIQFARVGYRISDIGHAIQEYAESYGYSLVREYVGHGVGASLHEAPEIPNYGKPGHGPRLQKNMTIAVEPMVNVGGYEVRVLDNGWTVVTADGSLSAHYENSLLVTDGEPEILTFADDI